MNKYRHLAPRKPWPGALSRHVGKRHHRTLGEAQAAAEAMHRKHGRAFHVYECLICRGYHVGGASDGE